MRTTWGHQHHHPLNFKFGELWWCATVECFFGLKGGLTSTPPPNIISSNQAPRRFNKGRQELGWITNAFTRLHKCGILGCDMGSNLMMGGPHQYTTPQIISGLVDCWFGAGAKLFEGLGASPPSINSFPKQSLEADANYLRVLLLSQIISHFRSCHMCWNYFKVGTLKLIFQNFSPEPPLFYEGSTLIS